MSTQPEAAAGTHVHYAERVNPPAFAWILLEVMAVSLGLAYGAVLGTWWGLVSFVVVQGIGAWWLLGARARIRVDDRTFVAGRATLPLEFVGAVTALDEHAAAHLAGPGADARAYLVIRGSTPTAVRVDLTDPADPTPYWLVATKHPEALCAALALAAGAHRRDAP